MTDLLHDGTNETDETTEAIVERLEELRASPEAETGEPVVEEEVEEVASTEAPEQEPEDPGDHPSSQAPVQEQEESEEERELRWARTVAKELRDNPELGEALVALKQGKATLIDRQVIEAAQQYMAAQNQPEQEDPSERFYADPAAYTRSLEERLDQLTNWQNQQVQSRLHQENASNAELLVSTGEKWQSRHPGITEEQVQNVASVVADTNLIRRYLKRNGGNKEAAVDAALEAAWRMEYPQLAQASIQNEAIRNANRARRAGATAASPRSARTPEERPRPRNRAERTELTAELLRELDEAQT